MADNEPMTDRQLEVLGQEIAIPLQAHAAGPVARLAQRNAWASLNYLITKYQELRAVAAQRQTEIDQMRPIVEAVADIENSDGSACFVTCELVMYDSELDPPDEIRHTSPCIIEQARAFLASAGQAAESDGE